MLTLRQTTPKNSVHIQLAHCSTFPCAVRFVPDKQVYQEAESSHARTLVTSGEWVRLLERGSRDTYILPFRAAIF